MRRVASPCALTVSWVKFASFMKVVGTTAVARTLTTLTPVVRVGRHREEAGCRDGLVDDVVPI